MCVPRGETKHHQLTGAHNQPTRYITKSGFSVGVFGEHPKLRQRKLDREKLVKKIIRKQIFFTQLKRERKKYYNICLVNFVEFFAVQMVSRQVLSLGTHQCSVCMCEVCGAILRVQRRGGGEMSYGQFFAVSVIHLRQKLGDRLSTLLKIIYRNLMSICAME